MKLLIGAFLTLWKITSALGILHEPLCQKDVIPIAVPSYKPYTDGIIKLKVDNSRKSMYNRHNKHYNVLLRPQQGIVELSKEVLYVLVVEGVGELYCFNVGSPKECM